MKKKAVALAAILFTSSVAFAQSNSTTSATTNAAAAGGTVVFAPQDTSTVRYATSSAFAPPLTSSNDTCMGSSSMGATGMSFGVALGSTWTDNNCTMLKNAREEWNMGQHIAAIALLCTDDDIRYSISVSGGVMDKRADGSTIRLGCPMTKTEWIKAGRPMIDPETGFPVTSGAVVTKAPVQTSVITYEYKDGVKETIYPPVK
jgi:hypothetical protein